MVNVAVAGGTGGVGRAIVEVLLTSGHEAFIFSRRQPAQVANTIAVDYNDIEQLNSALQNNQIHTVISAFAVKGDSLSVSQMNLIKAAAKSNTTKRFIPSGVDFLFLILQGCSQCSSTTRRLLPGNGRASKYGLEWTVFHTGIFLDYFGGSSLKSYLQPNVFVVDIQNKVAGIPGDGDALVTFTYTFDLVRFVVASLDLEKWDEESRVVGDEMSWNDFVGLAEETRGSKFEVHYDSVDKLKRFEITELPGHMPLYDNFPRKNFPVVHVNF
ncbi:uncharacterized protein TRUGW13939_03260 [Talaromyces rugulosus]|uniref:NAD(P)-binding domain-containing protein n=1 Tax=Talaromyces rugulosus TaxID=121627 RepID=A0A7H8QQD3_TALRU|nr:uncharacterized protein TRUGW13939_03260 [Talaromyces rugulosus]QKX56160.1 hypothetical protein TRUGW13939_03260 [Talaromyces rugulosus]